MAIMAECPLCRKKQSIKNKLCKCGQNLDAAKKWQKVRYWIDYRLPDGTQRRESVDSFEGLSGYSLEDAKAAFAKKTTLKKEKRLLDILPESKMTFNELTDWYLGLEKVKGLSSFWLIELSLKKFNSVFGDTIVSQIKSVDLENYQIKRKKEGKAPGTIDHEIGKTKTMIIKAFDNDLVGAETLKVFKRVKKTLKRGEDVRDRILSKDEFDSLMKHSPVHFKSIIATGYYTGMRRGEILNLTWDMFDMKGRIINLPAEITKDNQSRKIPISEPLFKILKDIPRAIHDNHVFLYKGKPLKRYIRGALKSACKKSGIKYGRFVKDGFIFHDLRHTFNTNMRKAGVQESVIMSVTGHSTREMFDRYNKVDGDDTRNAVKRLEAFLENVDQSVDQAEK